MFVPSSLMEREPLGLGYDINPDLEPRDRTTVLTFPWHDPVATSPSRSATKPRFVAFDPAGLQSEPELEPPLEPEPEPPLEPVPEPEPESTLNDNLWGAPATSKKDKKKKKLGTIY